MVTTAMHSRLRYVFKRGYTSIAIVVIVRILASIALAIQDIGSFPSNSSEVGVNELGVREVGASEVGVTCMLACPVNCCDNETYRVKIAIPTTKIGAIIAVSKAMLTIAKGLVLFDLRRICSIALSTSALFAIRVIVVWFDSKA